MTQILEHLINQKSDSVKYQTDVISIYKVLS